MQDFIVCYGADKRKKKGAGRTFAQHAGDRKRRGARKNNSQ